MLKITSLALFTVFVLAFGPAVCLGEEESQDSGSEIAAKAPEKVKETQGPKKHAFDTDPPPDKESLVGEILFSLMLVAVLGGLAYYLSKRFMPKLRRMGGKHISIKETAYLGQQKTVHLLGIGSKTFLVGCTSENIRLLADVSDEMAECEAENDDA